VCATISKIFSGPGQSAVIGIFVENWITELDASRKAVSTYVLTCIDTQRQAPTHTDIHRHASTRNDALTRYFTHRKPKIDTLRHSSTHVYRHAPTRTQHRSYFVATLLSALTLPLLGKMLDKWGVRKMGSCVCVLMCVIMCVGICIYEVTDMCRHASTRIDTHQHSCIRVIVSRRCLFCNERSNGNHWFTCLFACLLVYLRVCLLGCLVCLLV